MMLAPSMRWLPLVSVFGCFLDVAGLPDPPSSIPGVDPYASEKRCRDLGEQCACSEPLNVAQAIACDQMAECYIDPLDSEGPAARECDGYAGNGQAVWVDGESAGASVDPITEGVPFPAGSPVRYVWLGARGTIGIGEVGGNRFEATDATVCIRSYQRWHATFPPPPDSSNSCGVAGIGLGDGTVPGGVQLKTVADNPAGDKGYQLEAASNFYGFDGYDYGAPEPKPMSYNDCRNSWCRFEVCVDHDGQLITARGRITELSSGLTQSFGPIGPSNIPNAAFLSPGVQLVSFSCSYGGGPQRYASHAMQASVTPHDSSFWIGGAAEVERLE